ncbi:hypothetical protein BDA99DRAFT_541192 [Phascolomyces articulosus]|uniref:Uncharacterized protein n=1 Tax=Phascolomyces articulosus TaxID=60185 RepID=A0AAD5JSM0_9FUNG|nr:hypothetical protein BDA99DRAFT_541192 [Phascolomyces articulosus]
MRPRIKINILNEAITNKCNSSICSFLLKMHDLLLTSQGIHNAVACRLILCAGSIGSAVGGQVYFDGSHFFWGHTVSFIILGIQTVAMFIFYVILKHINQKRSMMTSEEKEKIWRIRNHW